jgi:hypothetical protein
MEVHTWRVVAAISDDYDMALIKTGVAGLDIVWW